MARDFDGTDDYLETSSPLALGYPFSVSAWFQTDSFAAADFVLIGEADNTGSNAYWWLGLTGAGGAAVTAGLEVVDTVDTRRLDTSATVAGDWHHVAAVLTNATSRALYLDGGNKVTQATSVNFPPGVNRLAIGRRSIDSPDDYLNGRGAEIAIWSAALDDAEVAALGKRFDPTLIRPTSLAALWRLFGNDANERDYWKSRVDLTVNGATKADHAPMIYAA